jgi:hypothetical protein
MMSTWFCPASVSATHDEDRRGVCAWCGRRTGPPQPRPAPNPRIKSDLDLAYSYYWDPDFGTDRADVF